MSDREEGQTSGSSEEHAAAKKHDCADCTFCQWCGDDRCRLCRGEVTRPPCKPSLAEQIRRYEEKNRQR